MNKLLHTKAIVKAENVQETGVIDMITGSSSVVDRMGDIIDQNGWDLKNFKTNPVILWGHNVREERAPIGRAIKVWIEDKGKATARLMFKVQFDLQDNFAAEIFRKVKEGFVNTVSVGFIPSEWEELDPDNWFGGLKFLKSELLELSFVPVPANPEALVGLRALAKSDKRFTPFELKDMEKKLKTKDLIDQLQHTKDVKDGTAEEEKEDEKEKEPIVVEVTETETAVEEPKEDEKVEEVKEEDKDEDKDETAKDEADKEEIKEEEKEDEEEAEELTAEQEKEVMTAMFNTIRTKSGRVLSAKNEGKLRQAEGLLEEVLGAVVEESEEADVVEEEKDDAKAVEETVIEYKDLGIEPEATAWDGPGEVTKAEVKDLKDMSAWVDTDEAENKSAYKFVHHKSDSLKAVFLGVAASMATLMGAKGGTNIPEEARKGVYDHLAKHYKEFGKTAPDYKNVEDQILASLGEEINALTIEREEKHIVKLVKRVLDNQKKDHVEKVKEEKKVEPSEAEQVEALKLIDLALTLVSSKKVKGGEK